MRKSHAKPQCRTHFSCDARRLLQSCEAASGSKMNRGFCPESEIWLRSLYCLCGSRKFTSVSPWLSQKTGSIISPGWRLNMRWHDVLSKIDFRCKHQFCMSLSRLGYVYWQRWQNPRSLQDFFFAHMTSPLWGGHGSASLALHVGTWAVGESPTWGIAGLVAEEKRTQWNDTLALKDPA